MSELLEKRAADRAIAEIRDTVKVIQQRKYDEAIDMLNAAIGFLRKAKERR